MTNLISLVSSGTAFPSSASGNADSQSDERWAQQQRRWRDGVSHDEQHGQQFPQPGENRQTHAHTEEEEEQYEEEERYMLKRGQSRKTKHSKVSSSACMNCKAKDPLHELTESPVLGSRGPRRRGRRAVEPGAWGFFLGLRRWH